MADEDASDWTEPVMTRVSVRAKRALEDRVKALHGVSQSAYLRRILYRDLGLSPKELK